MSLPPLRYVFEPFSVEEVRVLERFVRKVDELNDSELAQAEIKIEARIAPGIRTLGGQGWRIRVVSASEKEVKAAIGDFRQLYMDHEQASAARVIKILTSRARERGTPVGRRAIDELRSLKGELKRRRKEDPRGKLLEEGSAGETIERTPEEVIETWLHGEYLHGDLELAERLGPAGDTYVEMLRHMLHTAIQDYIARWSKLRGLVAEALKDPALRDAA